MVDDVPFQPRPADFKTVVDGTGGLVRITLVGGPHEGREMYIDEAEIPGEIYTASRRDPFEWWPERLKDAMARTVIGGDPAAPPIRYVLSVDAETREASFVADPGPGEERPG
jgi:hypothetical protein